MNTIRKLIRRKKNEISSMNVSIVKDYYITMLYFANMSYHPVERIVNRLEESGAINISVYTVDTIQAFLVEYDDFVVVSFRGTTISSKDDYMTILKFWKKPFKGIMAHAGFVDNVSKVYKKILNDLDDIDPKKRIIYTGHSMGGASAFLMAAVKKPNDICVFGCPKVFGDIGSSQVLSDISILRIETKHDLIVKLPSILFTYEHYGDSMVIPSIKHPIKSHKMWSYLISMKHL